MNRRTPTTIWKWIISFMFGTVLVGVLINFIADPSLIPEWPDKAIGTLEYLNRLFSGKRDNDTQPAEVTPDTLDVPASMPTPLPLASAVPAPTPTPAHIQIMYIYALRKANGRACQHTTCETVIQFEPREQICVVGSIEGENIRNNPVWFIVLLEDQRQVFIHSSLVRPNRV